MSPKLPKFAKNALKIFRSDSRSSKETAATGHPEDDIVPWGSNQKLESTDITKMCLRIPINWKVSSRYFECSRSIFDRNNVMTQKREKKQVYRIRGSPNVRFSLKLTFSQTSENDGYYVVTVKQEIPGSTAVCLDLKYAYVAHKHNVYHLAVSEEFDFDTNPLTYQVFRQHSSQLSQWGYVTVHCLVRIDADVTSRLVRAMTEDKSTRIEAECEIGRRSNSCSHDGSFNTIIGKEVEDFLRDNRESGNIQNITVGIAKILVENGAKIGVPHLQAFSVNFLMKNLTATNVLEILKLSQGQQIESLKNACVYYLYENCKAVIG